MSYNIVMFAYNEEDNIVSSIESVFSNVDEQLNRFIVIANGCTDKTVLLAEEHKKKSGFSKMEVVQIKLGDKCNAWNTYIHELSDNADTHFFCDADVKFSHHCFSRMDAKLQASPQSTVVIAGLPLSGRNIGFYRSLVIERACFFGNLYGVRSNFISRLKEQKFRLPIGLNWIDSFLTKAVNTDLKFGKKNLPKRTTWEEGCGYEFDSLSLFRVNDIKLYISRISRYELGKLQEVILDGLSVAQWPENMSSINHTIWNEFSQRTTHLGFVKRWLVKRRLRRLLALTY